MAKKPSTKKDIWKQEFANTHKNEGRGAIEKRENFVRSQGGNEWDVKGFDRFMDYRTARKEMYEPGNTEATSSFTQSYNNNQEKLQEKWDKEAEEKRITKEAETKNAQEVERVQKTYGNKHPKENSFISDLIKIGTLATKQALTKKPQTDDALQLALDYVKKGIKPNDATSEIARGISRTTNTFAFGLPKEIAKDKAAEYHQTNRKSGSQMADVFLKDFEERKGGEKAADFVYDALGYLAPASKLYGTLNASKAGKALTNYGSQSIGKRLASEAGKGAIIGNLLSNAEVGAREAVNPADYNWKDNAKQIAFGTATGAIADPALYGLGKGIGKGFESASNKAMKNILPDKNEASKRLSQLVKEYHQEQAPLPNKPDPRGMNDLIPSGSDITNPKFVSKLNSQTKPEVTVPKYGQSLDEILANPRPDIPEIPVPKINEPVQKADTSPIDSEIETLTRQIEQVNNQPKPKTKTEIDDALRSLEINDGYLSSSKTKGKISDADYRQKIQENELKRESLLNENQVYTHDVADELKPSWNNDAKSFELGDYSAKKAYGGGLTVKKGSETIGKFRTEEDAKRFMQESVATEKGIDVSFDKEGVLNWKSTYDESSKKWDIQAGDYSIHRGGKDNWTVKNKNDVIGTYKNEKKAQEVAQRHYDSQSKVSEEAIGIEQRLNELSQQREGLLNPPKNETMVQQEPPLKTEVTQSQRPENLPHVDGERQHFNTIANSDKISPELLERIQQADRTYTPMTNKEQVDFANEYVSKDIEQAYQFVKNTDKLDPRHIAVGHRLIDEFQKAGNFDKALDVVEVLAEHGTKSGQNVQAFSLYNKLSPEGQLLRAQRRVNQINEHISNPKKQVKLTEQNIQDITHAADSIQKMTGQQEQTNNVIKIMDSIKNGKTATDVELETVRSFVDDAKKFIGDLDVKPAKVKPVKDVRTRDKIVNHMNSAEEAARQRILARKNRANSLPVDIFYDYTVIGASKIAKGTVKFADFSEQMVKEFGDDIKPYIQQVYNKAVETFNLQSQSMTAKRLSEVEKITNKALKDKSLSEDEAEVIREFASRIGNMSGDARLEASMELQSTLQALERPTFGQMLSTAQTIAQLFNPKTIVRNAFGNELFYRLEQINKLVATPVDIARSKLFGKERTITFISNNQGHYWENFFTGGKAGWKGVNPLGLNTAYDIGSPAFSSNAQNLGFVKKALVSKWNPLKYLEKGLGATLRSFDNAGYMRAYNKTIGELATLRAINEGLKGDAKKQAIQTYIREADQNMIDIADQYGKYATFQDNTKLSTLLTKAKQGMNEISTKAVTFGMAPTKDFGFGDLILKYPKTPGNLIMRALEYSPAGVVRGVSLLKDAMKTKNPLTTKESTLAFTRAITGTAGFSLLGFHLADLGILTGRGDTDYEVATLERNAGKQPNSVNVSALKRYVQSGLNKDAAKLQEGDTFYSYDWAQPISMAIALGVGVNQSVKENKNPSALDMGKSAVNSAVDTVVNMSVLSGLNNFINGYQGEGWTEKAEGVAKGALSSFVPTALNQVRQLNDNTARTTHDDTFTGETLNRAKNRIPSAEKSLPPAYDTLGNERETYQNGSNNPINVLLNPSFVSKYQPSAEEKFVIDFINKNGDKKVAPYLAKKKLDGQKLTGEQYAELQSIMGTETQKGFKDVIPDLKGETDIEKISKTLRKVIRDAAKTAKGEIKRQLVTQKQLDEANKKYDLNAETVNSRIAKGWTIQRALTTPWDE
ncbi:hypothetical protein V7157_10465 [Neobacillus drentensis]|uniref:hypothetical protein n=1 Tax=Neobacillus drentensis TaxID=220684 RepID=UPI002FFDBEB2